MQTNVYANGALIATDDTNETHFYLTDWLGTRRVQTNYSGVVEQDCMSLPYGDSETCGPEPAENLYTGKARDEETAGGVSPFGVNQGNDYFGARYYNSVTGRWLSPDPSGLIFADSTNPQSLNLYSYVQNNPLVNVDPTGMDCVLDNGDGTVTTNTGDCDNSTEARANAEYYIDCDGCTSNAAGANLDQATGTLSIVDSSGQLVDPNAAISGFADPQGVTTNVTVDGSGGGIDISTGYGYDGSIGVARFTNLPFIPGLVVSNPNGPTGPPRSLWGTIKAMANCWATGDPDHHIGPNSPQPSASSDSIPNKAADLSVSSRSGKTMSPNVGNPEAEEEMGKGGDSAAMFTDISHCVYGR